MSVLWLLSVVCCVLLSAVGGPPIPASGLYIAPCSREAAAFAAKAWHYSRSMPAARLICVGVWEAGVFVGAVIFGRGASSEIGSPFGLRQSEVCELCRVALGPHTAPTSQIVSIAVRLLRRFCPGLRLIVSYADPEHGHLGVLYQAMNWLYLGQTNRESLIRLDGRLLHPRTVASRYRTRSIEWLRQHVAADAGHVRTLPKHRYVLPLDAAMRAQLAPRVEPYPKAVIECDRGVASAHAGRGAGFCHLAPAATSTREEAGAIPDPVAPRVHEAAHV